jgi:hypothetical protein
LKITSNFFVLAEFFHGRCGSKIGIPAARSAFYGFHYRYTISLFYKLKLPLTCLLSIKIFKNLENIFLNIPLPIDLVDNQSTKLTIYKEEVREWALRTSSNLVATTNKVLNPTNKYWNYNFLQWKQKENLHIGITPCMRHTYQ